MIRGALIDTSILIAAGGDEPAPDLRGFDALHISSLSTAELAGGVATTSGVLRVRRQARLADIERIFGAGLPFDDRCAREYLLLTELVVAAGGSHRAHMIDRMIAATARANRLVLLTRNIKDVRALAELVEIEER